MILKPYNTKCILRNIETIFKSKDITKLNKPTYNFLYLISGFIAHYDLYGFQHYYSDLRNLIKDLKNSSDLSNTNYWVEDYFIKSYGIDYCNSKVKTLEGIKVLVEKYEDNINNDFSILEKQEDLNTIKTLMAKNDLTTINLN